MRKRRPRGELDPTELHYARLNGKLKSRAWRAANLEHRRKYERDRKRDQSAQRRAGTPRTFKTPEPLRTYKREWMRDFRARQKGTGNDGTH